MLSVKDLRNGTIFSYEGDPWKVTKYEHIFQGRGRGKVNIRAKNLKNGNARVIGFQSSENVEEADLEKKKVVFKYRSRESAVFSAEGGDEELEIPLDQVKFDIQFLVKDQECYVVFYEEKPLGIILPPTVNLTIKKTDPGVKGDSVSNTLKPAVLNTGLVTKVPLFINEGEEIIVGTEEGDYRGRAQSNF